MEPSLQRRESSDPVGTIRLTHSPASAFAASDRLMSEGNRSRSFCRSLRAHTYSAERTVIPIRRNGRPGRMGSKRPSTPRETRLHPAARPSNRLNLLVTRLSSCTTVILSVMIRFRVDGRSLLPWGTCILVFGRLLPSFSPLTTTAGPSTRAPGPAPHSAKRMMRHVLHGWSEQRFDQAKVCDGIR